MLYPLKPFPDGLYKCVILNASQVDNRLIIRYDIAEGPYTGWASKIFNVTGKWPLLWNIDKDKGEFVVKKALEAINAGRTVPINSLLDAVGRNIVLLLDSDANYINVRKSFPVSPTVPGDILIGTSNWAKGSVDCNRAVFLAAFSKHPVIYADRNEKESNMAQWAADHNHILLQRSLEYGDYALQESNIVVDRKKNMLELYKNFIQFSARKSREIAALNAQIDGKRLVYVTGTSDADNVSSIADIVGWRTTQSGHSFKGTDLAEQLFRHMEFFHNIDFIFVPENQLEDKIFEVLKSGLPNNNPAVGVQGP